MGVPTIALVGETFAGRHSATHLTAAGLKGFCTETVEDYINLAISWSARREELSVLRRGLREKVAGSPLNDHVRFGEDLDAALVGVWQGWCALRRASTEGVIRSD